MLPARQESFPPVQSAEFVLYRCSLIAITTSVSPYFIIIFRPLVIVGMCTKAEKTRAAIICNECAVIDHACSARIMQ